MVKRSALLEGVIAVMAGLALFGAAAGMEMAVGAGPTASAILEELGKAALLLLAGRLGILFRAGQILERNSRRQARSLALGAARGLSLGLVAIAVFAAIENMAYLIAFPESGVLTRLVWSLPVHLVAALAEAMGTLFLFRYLSDKAPGWLKKLIGTTTWIGSLALAMVWHIGANLLVSGHLTASAFTAGMVTANLLFLVLLSQFLRQAYLGGFLHGAD